MADSPLYKNDRGSIHSKGSFPTINGKNTGQTAFYTVPSNSNGCLLGYVDLRVVTANGASIPPTVGIGKSSGFNQFRAAQLLTDCLAVNDTFRIVPNGKHIAFNAGDVICADVTIAATATDYEFQVVDVGLFF